MTFSTEDLDSLTLVAEQAAIKAGELLRIGFSEKISTKSKTSLHDIVTIYDTRAEEIIISTIKEKYPDHGFLGEESGLSTDAKDKITWIIDPLDGTINFARKIPLFSISIAAVYNEQVLCGVVYAPMINELFTAQKGKGAFLNGQKISVSTINTIEEGVYVIGFPSTITNDFTIEMKLYLDLLKGGSPLRNLGSGALNLAYVAAGRFDGFWIPFLHAWDMAAGKLLVEEAGGKVTFPNGKPIEKLVVEYDFDLLATNGLIHDKIINLF